jgi:putative membrane protein
MKNLIFPFFGLIILFGLQACQQKQAKNYNIDQDNVLFVKNGIEGQLTEILASGLVITNSNNHRIINLAKAMLDDHTNEGEGLKKLETDKKIVEKDTISSAHQQSIDSLSKKSGTAFDKAFLRLIITDHDKAVELYTTASQSKDADVNKFAVKTLPVIKAHLDSAKAILTSLK